MPSTSNFGATTSCSPIAIAAPPDACGSGANERKDECENLAKPSTSPVAAMPTFSNQLTTDLCTTSKNSKSRRMEYSMRGTKTCSSNSSCNPSQDSAFGSMTDTSELSIASNSCRMSSFQSMSSPIDESVEDSIGIPGPSTLSRASTASNNESIDISEYNGTQIPTMDFNMLKKKSASFGTSASANGLPNLASIEPPTILVNDGNSFYTTSPAKTFGTIQVFSQKYRVSSFEDMSSNRNFLRNVNKTNFRSLEEERRIDSAFTPVVKTPAHANHRSFDASSRCSINNSEKFKKLTHVSFASKISTTRERHTVWKNSILARKNNLIKSNESLHDYGGSATGQTNGPKATQSEMFHDTRLRKRVNSTNELSTFYRNDLDYGGGNGGGGGGGGACGGINRFSTNSDDIRYFTRKSCSERYLLNMTMLRQTTIGATDCDECDEDESIGGGGGGDSISAQRSESDSCHDDTCSNSSNSAYSHHTLTNNSSNSSSTAAPSVNGTSNSKAESNSTDSSPSHRSMCKIIGGLDDHRHIEEKIPLLDGMEMSAISPVENNEML